MAKAAWTLLDRAVVLLATGFGAGRFPFAPGTAGSAVAALLVLLLSRTSWRADLVLAGLVVATTGACLLIGGRAETLLGGKDPGPFVLDEWAGQFLACAVLGPAWPSPGRVAAAFVLFRIFDVVKPPPARWLQDLGGGAGIVLDDLAAAAYAWAALALAGRWLS